MAKAARFWFIVYYGHYSMKTKDNPSFSGRYSRAIGNLTVTLMALRFIGFLCIEQFVFEFFMKLIGSVLKMKL